MKKKNQQKCVAIAGLLERDLSHYSLIFFLLYLLLQHTYIDAPTPFHIFKFYYFTTLDAVNLSRGSTHKFSFSQLSIAHSRWDENKIKQDLLISSLIFWININPERSFTRSFFFAAYFTSPPYVLHNLSLTHSVLKYEY